MTTRNHSERVRLAAIPGTLKRVHVDQSAIRRNIKIMDGRESGELLPPLTVQTSAGSLKGFEVSVTGTMAFVYRPDRPLSCGARLWVETRDPVVVT